MSTFSTLANDLYTYLSAAMTGYDWMLGEAPDGNAAPEASAAAGFVWVTESQVDSHDQLVMETTAMVRVFPVQAENLDPQTPIDPTPLYQAVDDLQNALSAHQAPADAGSWYFQVTEVKLTHTPGQWFDATIIATGPNTFALT